MVSKKIMAEMELLADAAEAKQLKRFFKTGIGEYGEGDEFLGIRVPITRSIVKKYKERVELEDVDGLLISDYHEIRLAGLLLLVEIYNRAKRKRDCLKQQNIIDYYLSVIDKGNNWDLVDLVSYKVLGDWLLDNKDKRNILDSLAEMDGCLWHQRVAVVSTFMLIKNGEYGEILRITHKLLHHPHDLIHKAVGWMLREVSKRGGRKQLEEFLKKYASTMPRTMLRYAIEHFTVEERKYYLAQR